EIAIKGQPCAVRIKPFERRLNLGRYRQRHLSDGGKTLGFCISARQNCTDSLMHNWDLLAAECRTGMFGVELPQIRARGSSRAKGNPVIERNTWHLQFSPC